MMANEEKKPPQITKDDLGEYLEDQNGEIWKIVSYTEKPTFCIEKYGTTEREHFVVGAPITKDLTKLKREKQDGEEGNKKS